MATRVSKALASKLAKKSGKPLTSTRASKYGAVRQKVDGYSLDSKKEAKRYGELALLQRAKEIWDLRVHPTYHLHVNGIYIGKAEFDFSYIVRRTGDVVVEDCKGGEATNTDLSKWKRAHAEAEHGIKVVLI